MTRSEFSDLVISIWEGGEVTSQRKPDPREVWLLMDAAMSQLIYEDYKQLKNTEIDGRYFSPAEILPVEFNAVRNNKFTTLTSAPLVSPQGSAIILINPVQDDNKQFIMATAAEGWLTDGLEVGNLHNDVSFVLENKIVFYEDMPPQYTQVLVRSVKAISGLDENATIPVGDHLLNSILDIVLQKMGIQEQQAEKVVNIYKDTK